MKHILKSILRTKTIYIFLSLFAITFLCDFTYYQYVTTDQISRKYQEKIQAKQEAEIYNEYDEYLADFKNDLAEIELEETPTETYSWDYFYVDIVYSSILCTIICLGLSFLIFLGFHFTHEYSAIPFGKLFKATLFAYIIFPLSTLFNCIWFKLIQTDYQMEDIQQINRYLNPSVQSFLESPKEYHLYNFLFSDINLQSILFLLLIPLLLKGISEFKYTALLKRMLIPFLVFFITYQIISPYYIYLIL
ncbi:MAG: hypothetical protein ACEPOZ_14320 [Marinifilaceae bacterium]